MMICFCKKTNKYSQYNIDNQIVINIKNAEIVDNHSFLKILMRLP